MGKRNIYIEAFKHDDRLLYSVDVESAIILNIYKISASTKVNLNIKLIPEAPGEYIKADLSRVPHEVIETVPDIALYCKWPVIVIDCYVIAGLSSVSREIIKCSENEKVRKLLGFREACLMACSESSVWTRFCEVDMIATTKKLLLEPSSFLQETVLNLPQDILRFEYHMEQPVRMHNVYKVAREKSDKEINSGTPISELDLHHTFGEGLYMTLADVILFSCIQMFFLKFPHENVRDHLPLTVTWFNTMKEKNYHQLKFELKPSIPLIITYILSPDIPKQSLYTSDHTRYKPEKRIYTKQKDVTNSLRIINSNHIDIYNTIYPFGEDETFDWAKIPMEANPKSGALPEKRAYRKCDQLQNLAKAVIKLAVEYKSYRIVDFCSGSGHLGILLAFLLPNCEIVLVENKEQSLNRAKERIAKMDLKNVIVLQSNLDYFVGSFDIGVSLHACGVATDLVMQVCVKNKAHFVCCPCCYGAIYNCGFISYPRSIDYQSINMEYKDYLTLAHAADQTHDPHNMKTTQGFVCMDAIDTDRRLYAESFGYKVHLGKLQPCSCTNKNNLLVGIYSDN